MKGETMEPNAELIKTVTDLGVATIYLYMVYKLWTELRGEHKARIDDLKQVISNLSASIEARLTNLERRFRVETPNPERGESEARGGD